MTKHSPLLSVRGLSVLFTLPNKNAVHAVRGISFDVASGERVGIVGQTGSGKSVTARSILRLNPDPAAIQPGSSIRITPSWSDEPIELVGRDESDPLLRRIRWGTIAMVFQDPSTSFNGVHTFGEQLREALWAQDPTLSKEVMRQRSIDLFREVEIPNPEEALKRYPHTFSGGMKQRAMIAMALIAEPELLIADEPTTALDVSIQADILDLLNRIVEERDMGLLLITHDFGTVAGICDRIIVMHEGVIVEAGTVEEIFYEPKEPYTRALLQAARYEDIDSSEQPPDLGDPFVVVQNLVKVYPAAGGVLMRSVNKDVVAVNDVSFEVYRGETFALVGETGSGKTTTAHMILGVTDVTSGRVLFEGSDVNDLSRKERKALRRKLGIVFQIPKTSLDPRQSVGWSVAEPLMIARIGNVQERTERVYEMLELVGLSPNIYDAYPTRFSGGELQRIGIARALITNPSLVVLDESLSALDVLVRGSVLELLKDLQEKLRLGYIFIAHDLMLVERFAHRVAVMYGGKIVEMGEAKSVCQNPQHPYTQALLSAVPIPDPKRARDRVRTRMTPEDSNDYALPTTGCHFRTRCSLYRALTKMQQTQCEEIAPSMNTGSAACHFVTAVDVVGK